MSERSERLLRYFSGIRPELVEEAAEDPPKKRVHWKRWAAAAAAVALVAGAAGILPRGGSSAGGAGTNPSGEGPTTFMSYAGPVFPLTLREANDSVTAARDIELDFEPWVPVWWSNEDEANSREHLTAAERQEVLDDYNEWYPEGGQWRTSTDILVRDQYTLTNTSGTEQTLRVLYPFAGSLGWLEEYQPTLTVDGREVPAVLHAGGYAGGFEGVWNGSIGGDPDGGSVNLDIPDNWEDYRDALADGSYQTGALGGYPDLSGVPVIVYEFSHPWGEEENSDAGRPNPTIRVEFDMDVSRSNVLTYGFNGAQYGWETGHMARSFSIPQTWEPIHDSEEIWYLIVVGEDVWNMTTQGYATGGFDTEETIEAGVTVTRTETDLESVLGQIFADETHAADGGPDSEMFFGLLKGWLVTDGPLGSPAERYSGGMLEDNDVRSACRVFYLEAEVTVPAGGSVRLAAQMRKEASYDFYCAHTENRGVYGYDMVTELGSDLRFGEQTATIVDHGVIRIVRQNFGFDLETGIRSVALDPAREHYYLEVAREQE